MRKKKIRALVGFPLGVFAGVTLLAMMEVWSRNLSFGFIFSYMICGITGVLSISIATLFASGNESVLKEAAIHASVTFVLVALLFYLLKKMHSFYGVFWFLVLYFGVLLIGYVFLDMKTRKDVQQLNLLNEKRKSQYEADLCMMQEKEK